MLTEEISYLSLCEGDHYYIYGTGIGLAYFVDGNMEVRYSYGTIYDVSKYRFFTVPTLDQLL